VGVINEDYEDFVGLGTGLKGEGKRLERLTGPLESLKEDVEVSTSSLLDLFDRNHVPRADRFEGVCL
jgi:hypothetical protein